MNTILKFFAGILAIMFASRVTGIVVALVIGFLFYKYLTDPKYITEKYKDMKKTYETTIKNAPEIENKEAKDDKEARVIFLMKA